jgi:LemA protein
LVEAQIGRKVGTTGITFLVVALLLMGVLLLTVAAGGNNRLVTFRERVQAAWSDIDVQLARRHELIPNLVATAKAYGVVESDTLERVTGARYNAQDAQSLESRAVAENELQRLAARLLVVMEAYPDLKSDQSFLNLQSTWTETENSIAIARATYNNAVREYNTALQCFPQLLVGVLLFFRKARYFQADPENNKSIVAASSM